MSEIRDEKTSLPTQKSSFFWKWTKRILVLIIILLITLYYLLQTEKFQMWLAKKLTTYVANTTGAIISTDRIKLDIFEGIVLDNVVIQTNKSDTLLYGGDINISLRKNLFFLYNNELDLSYIGLKNFRLNIETIEGQDKSNLAMILDKLNPPKTTSAPKKDLFLSLDRIDLNNIGLDIKDYNKGMAQLVYLRAGKMDVDVIDLICKEIVAKEIILDGPKFTSYRFDDNCVEAQEVNQVLSNIDIETPFKIRIDDLALTNGYFEVKNDMVAKQTPRVNSLDYKNFYFRDINLGIQNFEWAQGEKLFANLHSLNATDNTGFEIRNISCDSIAIDGNKMVFPNYLVDMGNTKVQNKLSFSYGAMNDFKDFAHNVGINATFSNSQILLTDLEHFIPSLSNIKFVQDNHKELLFINGKYYGKVNNLAGRDVNIKLGTKLSLEGSFNTRDLLDPNNALINVRLDRFTTSVAHLRRLLPKFNLPPNFNKLGALRFKGRFDGYFQDFVAYGNLDTDLGNASMDMRLDIDNGVEKARYSGTLNLSNFDLGRWTDNADLGKVNFRSNVKDGQGLTLNTLKTQLHATVTSLGFKKYNYKDFVINGVLEKNTFNGSFEIHDPNIDFKFDGEYEYLASKSFLDFESKIKNIDLFALNLSKKPLTIQGDLKLKAEGNSLDDFTGQIKASDISVFEGDSTYTLENLVITSRETTNLAKELLINSDIGQIQIIGEYKLPQIVKSVKKVLKSNYPNLTSSWGAMGEGELPQKFNFNIFIKDSKNFMGLLGAKRSNLENMALKGMIDSYRNEISFFSKVPYLDYQGNIFNDVDIVMTSNQRQGDLDIVIDSAYVAGRPFNPITLKTKVRNDTIAFDIDTEKLVDSLENLDIAGQLIPHPRGYALSLKDNLIEMFGAKWRINRSNRVIIGKQYLDIENLDISDGNRAIHIDDINDHQGLTAGASNFDLNLINKPLKFPKMQFSGSSTVFGFVDNVFSKDPSLRVEILVPDFKINKTAYGTMNVQIVKAVDQPAQLDANVGDFLGIKGTYDLKTKLIDTKAKLRRAPMTLIQYLLVDGIKETEGYLDGDFTFKGSIKDPQLIGIAYVKEGATKIIYTGSKYYFDNQKISVTNTAINLDGAVIRDQNGNIGRIRGGLYHQLFKNFGVNASISGDNVVGLNTTIKDNPNYYGFGVGKINADFTGSFDQINMNITAVTGPGTKLFIPVNSNQSTIDKSFIQFVKRDSNQVINTKPFSIKGFDIAMEITLTPDAEVSIIFDESKGDIIKGRGRGNLKVDISRLGDFNMFGDYEIEQGQYLFTVSLLPVAKPFEVERGGRIRWTGDPVNTSLDITAKYRTRTAISPFIEEYLTLASPETQRLADTRSEVDLKLKLGGTLYKPDIKFDLSFPNLPTELSSFTDNKLRLLKTNELELNSQVVGLLVFKSFIPSNRVSDLFGTSGLQSASVTTLSEFISSQLSMAVTNLLNSSLTENGLISGVDFEVGVRNNFTAANNIGTSNFFPDEVEVRLKNRFSFWDERLSLNLGTNYVFQNQGQAINQVLPDFAFELLLTDDRKMKIRFYGKYDLDPITIVDRRFKYGLGVAYRTEFGSMVDFEVKLKEAVNAAINASDK